MHPDIKRERDILERHLGIIKIRCTNHNLQYCPLYYNNDNKFVVYTKKEEMELAMINPLNTR